MLVGKAEAGAEVLDAAEESLPDLRPGAFLLSQVRVVPHLFEKSGA
jgi:hypothetical protein